MLKQSATDRFKTASKRWIQKVAKVTGDLIGNNIVDKIKGSASRSVPSTAPETDGESTEIPKQR